MSAVNLEELKARILVAFDAFKLGNGPWVSEGGYEEYRAGFTNAPSDFAPQSVVEQAQRWWVQDLHGELARDNLNMSKQVGPAWSPARSAGTRGPAIKGYSLGRMVANFEYTDATTLKRFNYHVPLFPLALAQQPVPAQAAAAPSPHGWKLVNDAWVQRAAPQTNHWLRTVQKDPRGF